MSSLSLSQALSRCLGKPEQMKPLLTVAFSMQFMESSSSLLLPPCPSPPRMVFHMPAKALAITQQSLTTVYVQSIQKALDLLISQASLFQTDGEFILAGLCSFSPQAL